MQPKTVLAVDPGNAKCGMALVRRDERGKLEIVWRGIVATETLAQAVETARGVEPFSLVIVGGGTRSKQVVQALREMMPSQGLLVVDERDTTIQARERYWMHAKRRGWRRMLPASLQVPPEPVDDFVAVILAERVLTQS